MGGHRQISPGESRARPWMELWIELPDTSEIFGGLIPRGNAIHLPIAPLNSFKTIVQLGVYGGCDVAALLHQTVLHLVHQAHLRRTLTSGGRHGLPIRLVNLHLRNQSPTGEIRQPPPVCEAGSNGFSGELIGPSEAEFIGERDSFYMAAVGKVGGRMCNTGAARKGSSKSSTTTHLPLRILAVTGNTSLPEIS